MSESSYESSEPLIESEYSTDDYSSLDNFLI